MAISLQQTRCLLHPAREAVARCKGCEEYFCRECVGEYEGVMLCSSCLESSSGDAAKDSLQARRVPIWPVFQVGVGLLVLWLLWYGVTQIALSIPSKVHEGQFWEEAGD